MQRPPLSFLYISCLFFFYSCSASTTCFYVDPIRINGAWSTTNSIQRDLYTLFFLYFFPFKLQKALRERSECREQELKRSGEWASISQQSRGETLHFYMHNSIFMFSNDPLLAKAHRVYTTGNLSAYKVNGQPPGGISTMSSSSFGIVQHKTRVEYSMLYICEGTL